MSNSIGDLKNSGLQGNNFPWQLKMLEGLQKIYDEVKKPLTCAEDSIALCGPAGGLPVVIDCNDRISLCVNGAVVDATNSLPVTVVNPLPLEVNINQANDSILIYGFDGTTNQPISVDSSGAVNVNAIVTVPTPLPVSQDATSNPWTVNGTVALDAATLTALENITVQNGPGAAAVNIQDGGNSITVDAVSLPLPAGAATEVTLAAVNTKLTPATRTHNTVSATTGPTAIGSVPAGSLRGSVMNVGSAAGVWNGISIPAGVAIPWDAVGPRDTYGAIAYNATGTTLIIEYTT
jgi:hypothetical protein